MTAGSPDRRNLGIRTDSLRIAASARSTTALAGRPQRYCVRVAAAARDPPEAGFEFEVRPADVEEATVGDPAAVAEHNARRKALAISAHTAELVLGADTVVALDGTIYGKPRDERQARAYLSALSGRTHEVVGAIALAEGGEVVATAVERTKVTFRDRSEAEIVAYAATGEWSGRAGGYAIQEEGGSFMVERIEGDYLNVVGLPLERLNALSIETECGLLALASSRERLDYNQVCRPFRRPDPSIHSPPGAGSARYLGARSSSWASSRTSPASVAVTWP